MDLCQSILSDITVYTKYAKFIPQESRKETWDEIVDRNMNMHIKKFPELEKEIRFNYDAFVRTKKVLPSMRSMQFAGKPIEISPARIYNCAYLPMNHIDSFSETMFLLLSGCGVGYSVQQHHVKELPPVFKPTKSRRFLVSDSIEGWSDAVKVLMESYLGKRVTRPLFDFSDIRPKGARLKTSGGIAPGPEPLKECLFHIETILERKTNGESLRPIEVHDINCHIADAVLSGGIRRSAMISLFSFRDEEMLSAKFGDWSEKNPQRGRANNSVVILRHKVKEEEFFKLWEKIQAYGTGEPGFFFTNDSEWGLNPCAEISLRLCQFCNLVTINDSDIYTQEEFNARAKAASFIATLQASYTDFHYLRSIWKDQTEKDALIGVSRTGIASREKQLDEKEAALEVVKENKRIANIIGINPAARCTTVKPEGTTSLVLGTSSGIHAWHSPYFIRRFKLNKEEPIYRYLLENHPEIIEDDFFKPHLEAFVCVPQKSPDGSITKGETALQLLSRIKRAYLNWIKPGHIDGHNTNNVSATVNIKENEWDRVGNWMWENRNNYTAISIFPHDGGNYKQKPLEEIDEETYKKMYKTLKDIDLSNIVEHEESNSVKESVSCAGGACELV